jgi:hypothetical protein
VNTGVKYGTGNSGCRDKVVVPPPKVVDDVKERLGHGDYDVKDFYLCLKESPIRR